MTKPVGDTFQFRWYVDESGYEWRKGKFDSDPHLVARKSGGGILYTPLQEFPGLFREFAAIKPSQKSILNFANRYGDLFDQGGVPAWMLKAGAIENGASSLEKWKSEISDMNALVRLWEQIKNQSKKELQAVITWNEKGAVSYKIIRSGGASYAVVLAHPDSDEILIERFRRGDVLQPARYALRKEINNRLEGSPTIPRLVWCSGRIREDRPSPKPDDHLRIVFAPSNLLAAMWLQFAQEVTGEHELRRCTGCGKYFQVGPGGRRGHAQTCSEACRKRKSRKPK